MSCLDKCPNCKSTKIREIGWDVYPTDDEDVIEEEQYKCYDCKAYFFQGISIKEGLLPVTIHMETKKVPLREI